MKNTITEWLTVLVFLCGTACGTVAAETARTPDTSRITEVKRELNKTFSLRGEPLDPLMILDLQGGLGDPVGNPVAMDVEVGPTATTKATYLFGTTHKEQNGTIAFQWKSPPADPQPTSFYFSYKHLGTTVNGLHVIQTWENDGGSGTFVRLMLVDVTSDYEYKPDGARWLRVVLVRRGVIDLGDRYEGGVEIQGLKIIIAKDSRTGRSGRTVMLK